MSKDFNNFLSQDSYDDNTINESDVDVSRLSGFASFQFTDVETSSFGAASHQKLKLNFHEKNEHSDDENNLFSQFLKKSSTPLSPVNSLNESTLSLAKLEALEDEIDDNFLRSQTDEVERNMTQFLSTSKILVDNGGNSLFDMKEPINTSNKTDVRNVGMNQTEMDSLLLKDVKDRFGLDSFNVTNFSTVSDNFPFQGRLKQRPSELNRDAERLADQIMIERPNLDGSSSDSENDITLRNANVDNGASSFTQINPIASVQQQITDLNLKTLPERQLTEGSGIDNASFPDGSGGGDGSSDHSEDDLGADGGGSLQNQRLDQASGGNEQRTLEDDRITPPNRERPVGCSGNNYDSGSKQVQFAANPGSLNTFTSNQSSDNSTVTLTEGNADLDVTPSPYEEQESRLSSRYFLAASTPFLAASTFSDQSPENESRTMRLEDFQDERSILHDNGLNDPSHKLPVDNVNTLDWMKGKSQFEGPGDIVFGSGYIGNMEEEFGVINQDFEDMLQEDERVVAENNDTIVKEHNASGVSEWSVRTDNIRINPDLLPSVCSTNSDGNVSRYFKVKSYDMGKSIGKKGSRPKFSDAAFSIASPEKGSPVKLAEETVAMNPTSVRKEDVYLRKHVAGTTCEPITTKQQNSGQVISQFQRNHSDPSKKCRSVPLPQSCQKIRNGRNDNQSDISTNAGLNSFINNDTFSIPVCEQEAGTLLNNIQERRISIVGMENTQMEGLAKVIASLTGSDVRIVYKVLQVMSKEDMNTFSGDNNKLNLLATNKDSHASKRVESFTPVVETGRTPTNLPFSALGAVPVPSFISNTTPENLYHTLYPSVDRDSFNRLTSTHNGSTNTFKLATVTPYQVVNSCTSSLTSGYDPILNGSGNNLPTNDSMLYTSAGNVFTRNMNLNDAISYVPNINFGFSCLGEKTTKIFKMYNSNSCWIQIHFNIVFFAYNGCENSDHHTDPFIINPTKIVVGPNSCEEIKIKFLPKQTGSFMMKVELLAGPLVDCDDKKVNLPRLPKLLSIEGSCELPDIEVILGENKCIDFGEVPYGTFCSRELSILNKGKADVPVKLTISSTQYTVGFSFESSATVAVIAGNPTAASTVVKGCGDSGSPLTPTVLTIKFQAPHRPTDLKNKLSQKSPVEHSCQLDIKTTTEHVFPVSRVLMKAIVGSLRLHSLRTLQPICLSCLEGTQCKEIIPLRNAGNLTLTLALKICGSSPFFTLSPSHLKLLPGEESEVKISFSPDVPAYVESILKVSILPDGDEYEWTLKGKSSKSVPTQPKGTKPNLLCNTHALNWAGVPIGQSQQQKLVLRNSSDNQSINLSLGIAGDHANFQLVNDVRFTQKDMNKFEGVINPKGELPIHVLFLPTYLHMANSSLVLRTLDGYNKFIIPLSGYGGKSQLDISGANNLRDQFWIDMDEVYLGKKNIMNLMLRNGGSRAAFVSIKCFADITARLEYPDTHVCIMPNNFILKEKVSTQITLSYQPLQDHAKKLQEGTYTSAHLVIYSGDEVLRKAYRKQMNGVHGNPVLKNLDCAFANEENVNEDVAYSVVSDWNNFLHGCIDKTVIALVARNPTDPSSSSGDDMQEMLTHTTPAQKLKSSTDREVQLSGIWSVSPEKIVLNTTDEGSAGKLKIINYSNKVISFEFIWPGQTLVITPCKEKIPARCQLIVRVSAKASFLSGTEDLPWKGNIYIQCNGEQKGVEVEIGIDSVSLQSPMLPSNDMVAISPNDVSIIPHLSTGSDRVVEKHITICPPILEFSRTKIGCSTDSFVTIANRFDVPCVWNLISIAPPYCKCLDGKTGITRVTYTAFRFSRQFGTLGGKETMRLCVSFHPRSEGMYSQFWEIEVSSENFKSPTKTRLEVNGLGHCSPDVSSGENAKDIEVSTKAPFKVENYVDDKEKKSRSIDKSQLVFVKDDLVTFPQTSVGEKRSMSFRLCNRSEKVQKVELTGFKPPFELDHTTLTLRAKHYSRVPIYFLPQVANTVSQGSVDIILENGSIIKVNMIGKSS